MSKAKAVKAYIRWACVVGSGPFPMDMLRFDYCFPVRGEDAAKLEADRTEKRAIALKSFTEGGQIFNEARWHSFGWEVVWQGEAPGGATERVESLERRIQKGLVE